MAWALAYHRIFNARQVLAAVAHRILMLGILAGFAWLLAVALQTMMAETPAWVFGTLLSGSAVIWLDERSRRLLGLDDELRLAALRAEVIHLSQVQAGSERLTLAFERLLARHYDASLARILAVQGEVFTGKEITIDRHRMGLTALRECAWITPESLQRRRSTPALEDLEALLREHSLGVAVTVPRGSPAPNLIVVLGVKSNEWPFTYPEIRMLQNVAELMDSLLISSRLTDQAALQHRLEHLAMMSRGLAHDLKNLITPVSSFLVHTEGHFAPGSPADEVHTAARRSVRLMTEYIREALFFANNLQPRMEQVDLARLFDQVQEATTTRATSRGVVLLMAVNFPTPITGDGVLLQRLLANLVNNAIDASATGQSVRLEAAESRPGEVRFAVVDNGCGIAPELRERIFEPYFTTKEFGDEVRGFGLGLTVAQKIAHLHGGTITLESAPGRGTTFAVLLPTQQTTNSPPAPTNIPAGSPLPT